MNEFTIYDTLKPIRSSNVLELQRWARDYDRHIKYPATVLNRFGIAFYQVGQAMKYPTGSPNYSEAWAASIIHLLIVGEKCGCGLEVLLPPHLNERLYGSLSWERSLLVLFSTVQRHLWYREMSINHKLMHRGSRFKIEDLSKTLTSLIWVCAGQVGGVFEEAIFDATGIMTGKL